MAKDSAAGIELGKSPGGTFNVKFCESDFLPLWDELAEHKLLEGTL